MLLQHLLDGIEFLARSCSFASIQFGWKPKLTQMKPISCRNMQINIHGSRL